VDCQNLTLPDGGYDCNTKTLLKQPLKTLGDPDRPTITTFFMRLSACKLVSLSACELASLPGDYIRECQETRADPNFMLPLNRTLLLC